MLSTEGFSVRVSVTRDNDNILIINLSPAFYQEPVAESLQSSY